MDRKAASVNSYLSKNGSLKRRPKGSSASPPQIKPAVKPASAVKKSSASGRRRKRGRLAALLIMLILLEVGVILSLTTFFNINTIVVEGNTMYSDIQVTTAAGVKSGDNLLIGISKKKVELVTEKLPYIDSIRYSRKFPSTLILTVTETPAFFTIYANGEYILLDGNMKVLEKASSGVAESLIEIKTGEVSQSTLGKRIVFSDELSETPAPVKTTEAAAESQNDTLEDVNTIERTNDLIERIVASIIDDEFKGITEINLVDKLNIEVTYEDRIVIEFGASTDLEYKFRKAKKAIEQLDPADRGSLDVTSSKSAYYRPNN